MNGLSVTVLHKIQLQNLHWLNYNCCNLYKLLSIKFNTNTIDIKLLVCLDVRVKLLFITIGYVIV